MYTAVSLCLEFWFLSWLRAWGEEVPWAFTKRGDIRQAGKDSAVERLYAEAESSGGLRTMNSRSAS